MITCIQLCFLPDCVVQFYRKLDRELSKVVLKHFFFDFNKNMCTCRHLNATYPSN